MSKKMKIMIPILIILIVLGIIVGIVFLKQLSNNNAIKQVSENESNVPNKNPVATMEIKDYGTIKIELYPNEAPQTVKNFINLSNNGFYDGLKFHRIIKDFIIQGGDKNSDGTGHATMKDVDNNFEDDNFEYALPGEFEKNYDCLEHYQLAVHNNIQFEEGTIAMARADYTSYLDESLSDDEYTNILMASYNNASSQFFITTNSYKDLDGNYAAFGKVIEGMDIIHNIENVEVISSSKTNEEKSIPKINIIIDKIRVETFGIDYEIPEVFHYSDIEKIVNDISSINPQSNKNNEDRKIAIVKEKINNLKYDTSVKNVIDKIGYSEQNEVWKYIGYSTYSVLDNYNVVMLLEFKSEYSGYYYKFVELDLLGNIIIRMTDTFPNKEYIDSMYKSNWNN